MSKLNLRSNRKFLRLAAMLRLDSRAQVKGHLQQLWETSWENSSPLVGDFDDIEHAAEWPTANPEKYPRGAFAAALVLTGFLDTLAEGKLYAIHDWYEHLPHFAKQRVSRTMKEDATVCRETWWLGLETWIRRAGEAGIVCDIYAEEANGAQKGESPREDSSKRRPNRGVSPGRLPETDSYRDETSGAERSGANPSSPTPCSPPPLPPANTPDPEALAVWGVARDLLRTSLNSREEFDTWISPLRAQSIEGQTFRLTAPNARFVHTLLESFRTDIALALELAADRPMNLVIATA